MKLLNLHLKKKESSDYSWVQQYKKKFLQLFAIFELVQKLSITILSISNPVLYPLSIKSGKFERLLETHTVDWIFIKRSAHFLDVYLLD